MLHAEFIVLASELRSGDNTRLKSIFEQHAGYCISRLLSEHKCSKQDAEDIYIDALINFREKIVAGKLEALTDLRAYLMGTCKNMQLVRVKKEQRVNSAAVEINHLHREDHDFTQKNQALYKEELLSITEEALTSVPDQCQELLKLFYFDKMSLEEIATRMKLANANVAKVSKARCFRKLIDLVKELQQKKKKYELIK